MSYIINQGPLPFDGEKVDPGDFLEAWVGGTDIFNLDAGAFKNGTAQFVWSQSEAPRVDQRYLGMLWFKRGDGRLYMWDKPDSPSQLTFSDANWTCLSGRRELWCFASNGPILPGMMCLNTQNTNLSLTTDLMTYGGGYTSMEHCRPIWSVWAPAAFAILYNHTPELMLIASETAQSGTLFRAVEVGFVDIWAASGETGAATFLGVNESLSDGHFHTVIGTCGSACAFIPFVDTVDSSASAPDGAWLRPVFKHLGPFLGGASTR
jgi:hypothetical protein